MIRDPGDPGGAGGAGDTAGGVGGQENQHQACRTGVNFTTNQAGYLNKDTVRIKVLVIKKKIVHNYVKPNHTISTKT
jgi:hypothetical protein